MSQVNRPINNNYGRDQFIFNHPQTVVVNPAPQQNRPTIQAKLLESVKQEVNDRLSQTLHRAVDRQLINLGKETQPELVRLPWDESLSIHQQPLQVLPPETTILQVFQQQAVARKLLILGEPGAGKTTSLLELARDLVLQSEQNPTQPIPVLLNLSLWNNPKTPLAEWFSRELNKKYGIRRELGIEWMRDSVLLPLLDGLDEVAPQHQKACANALNEWLTGNIESQPIAIAVCCRRKEYEELVRPRLFLHGAIRLQPLHKAQIEQYLSHIGLAEVWHNAQADSHLQDILSTPLFLSIFGLIAATGKFDSAGWQRQTSDTDRQEYLFDCYWDATMKRPLMNSKDQARGIFSRTYETKSLPTQRVVQRALIFLARALNKEHEPELLIDRMLPSWLPNSKQKWMYRQIFALFVAMISGLIAALIINPSVGLIIGLNVVLMAILTTLVIRYGPFLLLFLNDLLMKAGPTGEVILAILVFVLAYSPFFLPVVDFLIGVDFIRPCEAIQLSISRDARRRILGSFREVMVYWLVYVLAFWMIVAMSFGLNSGIFVALAIGLIAGPFTALTVGLISAMKSDVTSRSEPNQGIKNARNNILFLIPITLLFGVSLKLLLGALLVGALEAALIDLVVSVSLFGFVWFCFAEGGGVALIKHIALRIVLQCNGYAPVRYDKLLDYCTERLLLQRVGGRYQFVHPLLQEYFSKLVV